MNVADTPAMDADELATFAATLPSGHLPDDVAEGCPSLFSKLLGR